MEVATLQPQDCLRRNLPHQRRQLISPATKPRRNSSNVNLNSNPNGSGNGNARSNRKRRNSPPPSPPNGSTNKAQQSRPKSPPVVGQVRILKRGEEISLPPPPPAKPEQAPPGQMIGGFYAGSAFVTSPAPSELPLPAFCTKRNCGFVSAGDSHTQEIACELRRVLKLY